MEQYRPKTQPPRCPDERARRAAARLGRRIGQSQIVDDPDLLAGAAGDESRLPPVLPVAIVRARSADDVMATLEVAQELEVPVTPRGAGTGKSGGAIPVHGGLVLATSGLNQILEIDRENLVVVAQPGVITGALHEAVEDSGLFYPPDPASLDTCFIGGNVAENAGGPRAFKYGVTGHYVLGAEVVIPGGQSLAVGKRTVKGVAGYDITSLFVGSEGTLGVFTRLTLRLVPRPQGVRTLMALFRDGARATTAVSRMVERGLVPRTLELLDRESVETLRRERKLPIPTEAEAMLLVEVDGDLGTFDDQVERVADACESEGAYDILATRTEAEARRLWEGRRQLSELLGKRRAHKLSDDIVVPPSAMTELVRRATEFGEARGVLVACYGHAGDGNLHVNVLWDDEDPEPGDSVMSAIVATAVELGGSITGEHGVGSAKKHLLPLEQSRELIELQRRIKQVFDPRNVLNPGKIFPTEK